MSRPLNGRQRSFGASDFCSGAPQPLHTLLELLNEDRPEFHAARASYIKYRTRYGEPHRSSPQYVVFASRRLTALRYQYTLQMTQMTDLSRHDQSLLPKT